MLASMSEARLQELSVGLPVRLVRGRADVAINSIVEDSRCCEPGCLFVARAGTKSDGRQFIEQAIERGAVAVLCPLTASDRVSGLRTGSDCTTRPDVAMLETAEVARVAAVLAERLAGCPSHHVKVVGVTGTNGKTTTTYLIRHILNAAGLRCGLIGTIEIDDGRITTPASLTTPPSGFISGQLAAMKANGCAACAMEVSSHALQQDRVAGVQFAAAVFTNLSGDHLDYHGTMDHYAAAKARLFEALDKAATAIVNGDDPHTDRIVRDCRAQLLECQISDRGRTCWANVHSLAPGGRARAEFSGPWGAFEVVLPLVGQHNVMNALQAAAACWAFGVDTHSLIEGLASCTAPPGRLELVTDHADDFTVLVDYAHTDDALNNVLQALRPLVPNGGKLRVVFGCGGDRDRTKRPRMAAVAARLADDIIITSDNPRTEPPAQIIDEVLRGVPDSRRAGASSIEDRRAAIEEAIGRAQPGDIILIVGKGHEDYQIIGTTKRPFDDRIVAREALALGKIHKSSSPQVQASTCH